MTTTSAQKLRGACEVVVATTLSYGFDWTFHNPLCGLLFQCGCTWNCGPWSGAACRSGGTTAASATRASPGVPGACTQDHPACLTVSDPFTVALWPRPSSACAFVCSTAAATASEHEAAAAAATAAAAFSFHGQAGLQAQEDRAEDGEDEEENKLRQLSTSLNASPSQGSGAA